MKTTKKSSTKKSLVLSTLSLVLCIAMLLGTTYAWFTDSVTSGKNRIVAGNLDVELVHSNPAVENEKVQGSTDLFKFEKVNDTTYKDVLWEPGMMVYENFTISNEGNLAFKYSMAMSVADYNEFHGHNLLEVLKVAVVEGGWNEDGVLGREAALALNFNKSVSGFTDTGWLAPKDNENGYPSSKTFGVVIYWEPTNHDNDYNVNNGQKTSDGDPLFVELGVNVIATQKDYEKDSFDETYDIIDLPNLPKSINKTFESAEIGTGIDGAGTVTVNTVDGESAAGVETVQVVNKSTNTGVGTVTKQSVTSVVQALVDQVVAGGMPAEKINITSDQNSIIYIDVKTEQAPTLTEAVYNINLSAKMHYTDAEGKPQTAEIDHLTEEQLGHKLVVVELDLGPSLKNVKVKHNDDPMAPLALKGQEQEGFFYDKNSGILTIKSKSFSPFKVTYENDKNVDKPRAYVTTYNKDNPVPAGTGHDVSFPYRYSAMDLTGGFSLNAPELCDAELDDIFLFDAFEDDADAQAMEALFGELGLSTSDTDQKLKSTLNDTAKVDAAIAKLDPSIQERIKQIVDSRKDYLNWIADYTISFDDGIGINSVALWGYYPAFGELGFATPIALEKDQEIPLLGTVFDAIGADVFSMNYLTICGYVRQFACGVSNLSEDNIGKTITVSLKLFPVDENGVKLADATPETVCTISYTFDRVNVPQAQD